MKVFKRVILYIIILIISLCVGYLINLFVSNNFVFEFKISKDILLSYKTYLYAFECFAVVMLFFIFVWYKKLGKNPKKLMSTTEKDIIYTGLEQAHFQTDEEIKNNFKIASYNMLPQVDIEGIPVKAEETKKGYDITFSKPAHTYHWNDWLWQDNNFYQSNNSNSFKHKNTTKYADFGPER